MKPVEGFDSKNKLDSVPVMHSTTLEERGLAVFDDKYVFVGVSSKVASPYIEVCVTVLAVSASPYNKQDLSR